MSTADVEVDVDVPWEPGEVGLPYARWRPGQRRAIKKVLNSEADAIALQLPTGFGKSGVGVGIGALSGRSVILTATKNLQDQYTGEAPELVDIRGMSNYQCLAALDEHRRYFEGGKRAAATTRARLLKVTCDDGYCHLDVKCSLKEGGCLYFDQQRRALHARQPITNYAYWLGTRIHGRGFGAVDIVVADEAHALVEQITGALRIEVPYHEIDGTLPRTIKAWREWAQAKGASEGDSDDDSEGEVEIARRGKRTPASNRRAQDRRRLKHIDSGWAWEDTGRAYAFEPITPAKYLSALWSPPTKLVLMSATMTRATVKTAGIDPEVWIEYPSTFPVRLRPVHVVRTAWINFRTLQDPRTVRTWLERHLTIIKARRDRKGVIHTGSYARARLIGEYLRAQHLGIPIFVPTANQLPYQLEEYRCTRGPAVLLSPAVTTGVDLPGEACEYQILSKVPFPDARSGITAARFKRIPGYRPALIMQTIVQAFGRGVRYDGDQCEGFILDNHAHAFLHDFGQYAPAHFRESLHYTNVVPPPLKKLKVAA